MRKCLALYLPLLAAEGDVPALAGASTYLRTRSNWTFNVMPDLARCYTDFKRASEARRRMHVGVCDSA